VWDPTSPSRQHFPLNPTASAQLEAFARQAILHQPFDYVRVVARDLLRYADENLDRDSPYGGESATTVSFSDQQPELEARLAAIYETRYTGTQFHVGPGLGLIQRYQSVVRVHGAFLPMLLLLAIVGAIVGRGRARSGALLLLGSAVALYLVPVMTLSYDYRYGVAPALLLVTAATLGAWTTAERILLGRRGEKRRSHGEPVVGAEPKQAPALGSPALERTDAERPDGPVPAPSDAAGQQPDVAEETGTLVSMRTLLRGRLGRSPRL
jgi:hypothetical protein